MIKHMLFVKRKPGLTREEFRDRYESGHAPLAIKHLPMLSRYVRNYVQPKPGQKEPPFDCVTEFWFANEQEWQKSSKLYAGDVGKILAADEEEFMDRSSMFTLTVEERASQIPGDQ